MTTRGGFEDPRSDGIVSSFPRRLAAAVLAVGLWAATFASASADVIFNEVMADNQTAFEDDEEFPDWIELYNTSATTDLSLNGWSLTDNPTVTNKFQFPSGTSIPARGFLMVWLDAAAVYPGVVTTNFSLKSDGEEVSGQALIWFRRRFARSNPRHTAKSDGTRRGLWRRSAIILNPAVEEAPNKRRGTKGGRLTPG